MGRVLRVFGFRDEAGIEHIIETQTLEHPADPPELYLRAQRRGINFNRLATEEDLQGAIRDGTMTGDVEPALATASDPFTKMAADRRAGAHPWESPTPTPVVAAPTPTIAPVDHNVAAAQHAVPQIPPTGAPVTERPPIKSTDLAAAVPGAKTDAAVEAAPAIGGQNQGTPPPLSERPSRPRPRSLAEHLGKE